MFIVTFELAKCFASRRYWQTDRGAAASPCVPQKLRLRRSVVPQGQTSERTKEVESGFPWLSESRPGACQCTVETPHSGGAPARPEVSSGLVRRGKPSEDGGRDASVPAALICLWGTVVSAPFPLGGPSLSSLAWGGLGEAVLELGTGAEMTWASVQLSDFPVPWAEGEGHPRGLGWTRGVVEQPHLSRVSLRSDAVPKVTGCQPPGRGWPCREGSKVVRAVERRQVFQ